MKELIKKLNQSNNFHLTFKVIQTDDEKIIFELKKLLKNNVCIIQKKDDLFEKLQDAFSNFLKYIICDESVKILLPILSIITKGNIDIVSVKTPVYYCLKDNKIIQQVKTECNKKNVPYTSYKNIEEMLNDIVKKIIKE